MKMMMVKKKTILFWNLCDGLRCVGLCHRYGSDDNLSNVGG